MNYLFAPESVSERQTIFRELGEAIGAAGRLEMFPDIVKLEARLRQFDNPEIIVILGVGNDTIQGIISLFDLLSDASIIVMLSNEEKDTVMSAIRLRPKFLGTMNSDLKKIVPVVEKLIRTKAARELLQS